MLDIWRTKFYSSFNPLDDELYTDKSSNKQLEFLKFLSII